MPKVTHVKSAQQRYKTMPVLDEHGQQKVVPVMKGGVQKMTKRGQPVSMKVTQEDRSQPLPMPKCDSCGKEIEVGTAYKWIAPKSGPYGGTKRNRHEDCPEWNVWDYSSSLSAQLARIENDYGDISAAENNDDIESMLSDAAGEIRELAQEKEDGADNIESGFGHETEMSYELRDQAEQLNSWADDLEATYLPDYPEPEEADCEACEGTGEVDSENHPSSDYKATCDDCDGSGRLTPDEPTQEQIDEWRSEAESAVMDAFGNCPV